MRRVSILARLAISVAAAVLTLALVARASAQQVDDAMMWALRTSPAVKSDDYRQQASEARLRGSIEAFLPTVEWQQQSILDSHYTYSPAIPSPSAGLDTIARREPDQFGVQASVSLFDGFKRYNTYKAASLGVEAGKYLAINARQQVMLDAATAYLAVLRDRAILTHRAEEVANIARLVDMTSRRYALRDSTQTDVAIADSRLLAAKSAVEAAKADLQSSEIEFVRVTGMTAGHFSSPHAPDALIPRSREEMHDALVSDNPQLIAARLDAKAAKFTADAVKAELLPTVNLVAGRMQANNTAQYTPKIVDATVKLQIRIPLYQPGAYSHINEAAALATQKNYDVIDAEQRSVSSADALFVTRQSLIRQTAQASARVAAMRRAVNGYRVEQDAGYRTIVDVLNALNELSEAEVFEAQMRFTRDKSTYMLVAALARLDADGTVVAGR